MATTEYIAFGLGAPERQVYGTGDSLLLPIELVGDRIQAVGPVQGHHVDYVEAARPDGRSQYVRLYTRAIRLAMVLEVPAVAVLMSPVSSAARSKTRSHAIRTMSGMFAVDFSNASSSGL